MRVFKDAIAQMRVDQGGKRLFLRIELLQEKTGGAELVLIRRILQQLDGFLAGDLTWSGLSRNENWLRASTVLTLVVSLKPH